MSVIGGVKETIRQYFNTTQRMSLSGIGHWHALGDTLCTLADKDVEECMGHDTLDLLEAELHDALSEVVFIRIHQHTAFMNEQGFCSLCGWDLNA